MASASGTQDKQEIPRGYLTWHHLHIYPLQQETSRPRPTRHLPRDLRDLELKLGLPWQKSEHADLQTTPGHQRRGAPPRQQRYRDRASVKGS